MTSFDSRPACSRPPKNGCLIRIARRLPGRINPDHLTALGALPWRVPAPATGFPPTSACALAGGACLAVNWFGDSLDGTLARVRNCQRPRYGFYADHVLDTVGVLSIMAGLGLSGHMTPLVAAVVLAATTCCRLRSTWPTTVLRTFRMGFFGFGPTELRILLAIGTVALFDHSRVTLAGHCSCCSTSAG